MILGLVVTEKNKEVVHAMNFRKQHDIRDLDFKTNEDLIQTIESQPCFTHILFEIGAVIGNSDAFIQLLLRLRKTTTIEYLVLLEGFPADSRIVEELLALGIKKENLIFSSSLPLRQRMVQIFYSPTPEITPFIPPISMEITHSAEKKPSEPDAINSTEIPEQTPAVVPASAPPPSKITAAQAHAELQARMLSIQKENLKVATQIAIAGAGRRIGTTTQALQILMYLRTQNKSAALVEMHDRPCLQSYADVYSDAVLHKSHCIINGNPLYFSQESLETIQKEYEYLILDFGNFNQCSICGFLKADVKIISCGIKPWETEQINNTFRDNDGSFQYLFSFVPPADEKDIVKQMEEFSQNTFFAPYSPDMFQYNGCDDMYRKLLEHSDTVSDLESRIYSFKNKFDNTLDNIGYIPYNVL